jgi:xanthine dehydrogenase YagS FAD-binding subunit
MHPFVYEGAADTRAASEAVAREPGARFLAGGTTLIDLMKLTVERPARVVDINALPLRSIEEQADGSLRIGALVRNGDLAEHALVRSRYPVLAQALLAGASAQVRNMATTAGNLMQRTRCYYFRDPASACNKRSPGSGCPAQDGYNRIHAVLGTSEHCIATHASDMAVALAALDATLRIDGPSGERSVPLTQFYSAPGTEPARETVLEHGELITAVDVPALPWAARSLYLKVRDRASFAFALASAAVALDTDAGHIREARIALGGVATIPWRAAQAEQALAGRPLDAAAYRAAAETALAGAVPRKHNAFKVELAQRTLIRALSLAGEMS